METIGQMNNGRMPDEKIERAYFFLIQRFNSLKDKQDITRNQLQKVQDLMISLDNGSNDYSDEFLVKNGITNRAELNEFIQIKKDEQELYLDRINGVNEDIEKYLKEVIKSHPNTQRVFIQIVDKRYREKISKYKKRAEGRAEALSFAEQIQQKLDDPKVGDLVESALGKLIFQSKFDKAGREGTTAHSEEYADALKQLWELCPDITNKEIMSFLEHGKARKTSYINKAMQDDYKKIDIRELLKAAIKVNKGQKRSNENTAADMEKALRNVRYKLEKLLQTSERGSYGEDVEYWERIDEKGTIQNKLKRISDEMLNEAQKDAKTQRIADEKERAAREKERKKNNGLGQLNKAKIEVDWIEDEEDDEQDYDERDDYYRKHTIGEKIKAWFRKVASKIGLGRKALPSRSSQYAREEDDDKYAKKTPLPGETIAEIADNMQKEKAKQTLQTQTEGEIIDEAETEELDLDDTHETDIGR